MGSRSWRARRERVLRELGLWRAWGAVPPAEDRAEPAVTYLPGGENYEEPRP
jgi:hypothetical protein